MALQESDFHGRYVHPETGIEYADFGDYFAGKPIKSNRNHHIESARKDKGFTAAQIRAYWEAYDACVTTTDGFTRFTGRHAAGLKARGERSSYGETDDEIKKRWAKALHEQATKSSSFVRFLAGAKPGA